MRCARGVVVAVVVLLVGVTEVRAQDQEAAPTRRDGWVDAWVVEGQAAIRHVFLDGDAIGVEALLEGDPAGGWRLDVRGVSGPRGFALRGEATADGSDRPVRATLGAEADGPDALRVELTLGGERRTERWRRLEPARLDLRVLGVRPGPGGEVGVAAGQPLDLEVTVRGRPLPVVVRVLAAEGEYERLGGIVAYEPLQDGATLPLGRHAARWDGLDRTPLDGRPLAPGTYRIVATPKDEALAGAPGEPTPVAAAEVILVVRPAPVAAPAPAPPAPPIEASAPTRERPPVAQAVQGTRPVEAQVRPFAGEGDTVHVRAKRGAAGQLGR